VVFGCVIRSVAPICGQRVRDRLERSLFTGIPFSFVYDGKPSAQFLSAWQRTVAKHGGPDGEERYEIAYLDPQTGLQITCEAVIYANYPAVEWLLRLTNTGSVDTPIIENILPLALTIVSPSKGDVALHSMKDSLCTKDDYLPVDCMVYPENDITLAPHKTPESTVDAFPISTSAWDGGGIIEAIGWTGWWKFRLCRDEKQTLTIQTGQEVAHLKLHPGEAIRTPRVLLVAWQGNDRMRGCNMLRRLLVYALCPESKRARAP